MANPLDAIRILAELRADYSTEQYIIAACKVSVSDWQSIAAALRQLELNASYRRPSKLKRKQIKRKRK